MSCSLVMSMSWLYIIHDACPVKPFFSPDFKFWLYQHSNSSPGDLEGCRRTKTLHVFTEHFTWKMLAFGTEARSDSAPLSLMAGTTLGDGDVGTGTRAWDVKSDIEAQGTEGPVSYKFPKGNLWAIKCPIKQDCEVQRSAICCGRLKFKSQSHFFWQLNYPEFWNGNSEWQKKRSDPRFSILYVCPNTWKLAAACNICLVSESGV